jgi:3-hydroxyisobutyrate dehydrogenase-like beta-hydroxyacid dehydrogenase
MGSALTRRLLDGGFSVVGFDVDPEKCLALKKLGGEPVASIADVASQCRRILIAVMTVA